MERDYQIYININIYIRRVIERDIKKGKSWRHTDAIERQRERER